MDRKAPAHHHRTSAASLHLHLVFNLNCCCLRCKYQYFVSPLLDPISYASSSKFQRFAFAECSPVFEYVTNGTSEVNGCRLPNRIPFLFFFPSCRNCRHDYLEGNSKGRLQRSSQHQDNVCQKRSSTQTLQLIRHACWHRTPDLNGFLLGQPASARCQLVGRCHCVAPIPLHRAIAQAYGAWAQPRLQRPGMVYDTRTPCA